MPTLPPHSRHPAFLTAIVTCFLAYLANDAAAASPDSAELRSAFTEKVRPLLKAYCLDCHGSERQEAKLDLSGYASIADVSRSHQTWEIVLERLEAGEMPPEDADPQPLPHEREAIVNWIRDLRTYDANQNAGDPGVVLARRLSNAEYNYTIRDLTSVDIRPTKTFPVDPANESGFDNTGESLTMSPALLNKYLEAAREVADHLVLTPSDIAFAPHPAVTDTDRDKYCVNRIVEFYEQQPTDLSHYFFVCWLYRNYGDRDLEEFAARNRVSPSYTLRVWDLLNEQHAVGPIAMLQNMFQALPPLRIDEMALVLSECRKLKEYVTELRATLSPQFENLYIEGNHKGSQPFVLWKNDQYASHRLKFDRSALYVEGDELPVGTPRELVLPRDELDQTNYIDSVKRFCSVFPDAFYISERGRDYLGVAREAQEKGRLLSAGFHSMMGYYRDDRPLYELILDDQRRATLDRLWQELDYVASAPARQYVGFLWFERTDSRYMRDPVFDFARAEDKNAASEAMIERLAEFYLKKAHTNGGTPVAIKAIEDYFANMNAQLRWVESARIKSEPVHLEKLIRFAERAWRRKLLQEEQQEIRDFYQRLRETDRLNHEEAMRDSVVSILMSPNFLYRVDLVSSGEGTRPLTSFELANRLSYFLWSSLPDQTLLTSLDQTDADSEFVATQARHMLDDRRIRGLATEFATNWLDVRRFEEHNAVDRERFPEFTDELRSAMFEEPIQFFVDLVRNDRSVLKLFDADYTFVNPVLAKHYGIEQPVGQVSKLSGQDAVLADGWTRVDDASQYGRGGLLPMSVFLTKNAPGLRTSPVKRGYWVVRRLLGVRIPPPPPNVPELPTDESQLGDLSLRETLARHRDNKSCAGCHDRFDAIGLAFEGFGPVGERRDTDLGGRPIEMSVTYPGGSSGSGIGGLQKYLREHRQQEFLDSFGRKLLSYALGRTLILSDERLLATMQTSLKENDYRFSSLIETIVTSSQFLNKRGN